MTLQQVRYLLEIAETGSISAAAKKLLLTQSDLSSLIRKIEQEFGITIFERTQKGVALTANGREFLKYARQNLTNEIPHECDSSTQDVSLRC